MDVLWILLSDPVMVWCSKLILFLLLKRSVARVLPNCCALDFFIVELLNVESVVRVDSVSKISPLTRGRAFAPCGTLRQ